MIIKMDKDLTFSECVQLSDLKIKFFFGILFGKEGNDEDKKLLKGSKIGKILVRKISDNYGYLKYNDTFSGITANFKEGMGLYISDTSEWYSTSVIKKIDWDNNKFETLNSVYEFQFNELDEETLNKIYNCYYESESN